MFTFSQGQELMRYCKDLTLVYNNYLMVKLVLLHVILLKVTEPIDDVK